MRVESQDPVDTSEHISPRAGGNYVSLHKQVFSRVDGTYIAQNTRRECALSCCRRWIIIIDKLFPLELYGECNILILGRICLM